MKTRYTVIAGVAALAMSSAAQAAHSDYYLKIDTVEGEAVASNWSFGACNAGQCATISSPRDAASGQASGKRQHKPSVTASQNTQSLRESPTRSSSDASAGAGTSSADKSAPPRANWDLATNKGARTAGGVNVATGDVDGDGLADLAFVTTQSEVSSFTLHYDKIPIEYSKVCAGKHIANAVLRTGSDSYELTGLTVSCTPGGSAGSERISTNMTVGKQTQGATFGERCNAGMCTADGGIDMVLTGGQMKHTKTGHVTLMK